LDQSSNANPNNCALDQSSNANKNNYLKRKSKNIDHSQKENKSKRIANVENMVRSVSYDENTLNYDPRNDPIIPDNYEKIDFNVERSPSETYLSSPYLSSPYLSSPYLSSPCEESSDLEIDMDLLYNNQAYDFLD
jgi:hypothetical protein